MVTIVLGSQWGDEGRFYIDDSTGRRTKKTKMDTDMSTYLQAKGRSLIFSRRRLSSAVGLLADTVSLPARFVCTPHG